MTTKSLSEYGHYDWIIWLHYILDQTPEGDLDWVLTEAEKQLNVLMALG